jgi:hypothetical protein
MQLLRFVDAAMLGGFLLGCGSSDTPPDAPDNPNEALNGVYAPSDGKEDDPSRRSPSTATRGINSSRAAVRRRAVSTLARILSTRSEPFSASAAP